MKKIFFVFYFLITPIIVVPSTIKEETQNWRLICGEVIVKIRVGPYCTYMQAERGTISDPVQSRSSCSTLCILGIVQKMETIALGAATAFVLRLPKHGYHALIYDPTSIDNIEYYNVAQPSKTFTSDPEIIKKLKEGICDKK